MIYGVSTIVPRLLQSVLAPFYARFLPDALANNGVLNYVYSFIPFLTVIFTYGMETAFFRFSELEQDKNKVYSTSFISVLSTTAILAPLLIIFSTPVAGFANLQQEPEFIMIIAGILTMDTLSAIPFASLRQQNRPIKYSALKIINTVVTVLLTIFFYGFCPVLIRHGVHFAQEIYDPSKGIFYVLISNLTASTLIFLLLLPELGKVKFRFDPVLWKKMMAYTLPLLIVGLAGVINDTFDKVLLRFFLPLKDPVAIEQQIGIYGNCYKLVLLINLFRQAFQYAADPFFFQHATKEDARQTYARVMKYFVIIMCVGFLSVVLFIDAWKYWIGSSATPRFWEGLKIVPIVLIGYMCLGVNYNLAIWYKLTNRTRIGAFISVTGAALTLIINIVFIPVYGYMASAWATLISYATIMVLSYLFGRKYYPIPYNVKRLLLYFAVAFVIYLCFNWLRNHLASIPVHYLLGVAGMALYGLFIYYMDKKDVLTVLAMIKPGKKPLV